MSYKKDIKIDKYDLDNEWRKQSSLVVKYGDLSVEANKMKEWEEINVERLDAELKEMLAYLSLKVKQNFRENGFEKQPTDASATAWAITQDEYKQKRSELFNSKEDAVKARNLAFKLRNVARAFEERRFSLQNIQQLFLADYYSDSGRDKQNSVNESMKKRRKEAGE